MSNDQILELVIKFKNLQGERTQWYQVFDKIYQEYVKGEASYETYNEKCQEITTHFVKISNDVQEVEQNLKDLGSDTFAEQLRLVQNLEREKLQLTAKYQIFNRETVLGEKDYSEVVKETEELLEVVVASINDTLEELQDAIAEL
ncbi:hypothetical protein K493DRAFT_334718 [Basidiobolus meristosporus CBS 931.73]|uniref:Uncharacterized protein n=1 Tax=Basidiobolus meristosporus CBS 931.73 TaxID=1314790 RepID=A0A1Y1YWT7_9FUNG|nr:hypothetical protein K493DRAFT_334718 [Basidiobolus meristosporus CBS 931.73]|eukprot:ORY02157.1 hypothetical protein K493DRAFT_334718 [Basidiobolus meristosporus CBS 931.73]